jgi:N-acetylglucosaminyldiphosphoundecaprenol N-acetyl-beta-D-mannosaminyltransferase
MPEDERRKDAVPPDAPAAPARRRVVSLDVDPLDLDAATGRVLAWAREGRGAYACLANVHMTMEAHDDPSFAEVVAGADLVLPDGMPLVWGLALAGVRPARRVRGPDLTLHVARAAAREGVPVALYGGRPEVLERFAAALAREAPGLRLAARISPPYRTLSEDEEAEYARELRASGARIVLVGLGCPKQERWMARNRPRLDAVLLGVGAAFDLHAGEVREAPRWLQRAGLEWAFRLSQEPGRLWRRYLRHNPRFLALLARQHLGWGGGRRRAGG